MLHQFHLYSLTNVDLQPAYPYVAVSMQSTIIIQIHPSHIYLLNKEDALFFETDYVKTNRVIEIDLAAINQLIQQYTGQTDYKFITRLGEEKHSTLTYHSPNNEGLKDYDIFSGYPNIHAQHLADALYAFMQLLQQQCFLIN